MDRDALRALQQPLKDRYRETPGQALVTLTATGTLGVDKTAPVGFASIDLSFDLDAPDASEEQRATLLELTERCCVVLRTLRSSPPVVASL